MKISVVIPNYNGRILLQANLPTVIKESQGAEIIVVDDASTDDSVIFLKKYYQEVRLVEKKQNSGFSSTVNLGVKMASSELIVLLNSDAYPKKNWLKPCVVHFKDPLLFAVGMLHENVEQGHIVTRGRGQAEFEKGFLVHRRGDTDKNDTFWVNCGAGIFRKSFWVKLGGLREIYDPFYWEDIDLSFRAVQKGYKIFFESASHVVHIQSTGSIRSRYSESEIKKIAYRNQFLFVWLNYRKPKYLLSHFLWLPYHFIKLRKSEFSRGFFSALHRIAVFNAPKKQQNKAN